MTLWNFAAMIGAVGLVGLGLSARNVWLFFGAYMLLVTTTGIGNGSTYRMIPAIFRAKAVEGVDPADEKRYAEALLAGKRNSSAAIGLISAIGAYGGFFINRGFAPRSPPPAAPPRPWSPSPPSTRSASPSPGGATCAPSASGSCPASPRRGSDPGRPPPARDRLPILRSSRARPRTGGARVPMRAASPPGIRTVGPAHSEETAA